jgi:YD repeat-containing protein
MDGRIASFALSAQTMTMTYDAASRIKAIGDVANPAAGNTYDYDPLDRLTNVVTPTAAQTYGYDAVGNRSPKVNGSTVTPYTYDTTSNRLTKVGAQAIATDANGSITNRGDATFNYDARGRMVSANTAIGLVTYTLNSLGQRVRKVTPTETTVFHYDLAGKLIAESTTAGATTTTQQYVYLGDMPVAVLK